MTNSVSINDILGAGGLQNVAVYDEVDARLERWDTTSATYVAATSTAQLLSVTTLKKTAQVGVLTGDVILWSSAVRDDDTLFVVATSATKIKIPVGAQQIRIVCYLTINSTTEIYTYSGISFEVKVNGTLVTNSTHGLGGNIVPIPGVASVPAYKLSYCSPLLDISALASTGDVTDSYVLVSLAHNETVTGLTVGAASSFSVEVYI